MFVKQESQLENERGKNEHLKEEADLLRRKALLLDQVSTCCFTQLGPILIASAFAVVICHVRLQWCDSFHSTAVSQARAENEELREELSEVTAQRNSVLEENQRLRAKLENLEQVLKVLQESNL